MKTSLAIAAAAILAAGIFLVPAARAQDDPALADPALIEAQSAPPQTVAPADVLKMLDDKRSDIAIVDTQPGSGFAEEHIPGALNYPWAMRIKTFPIPLPRNKVLIFYGSCPNDTADTIRQLAEFGYFNVRVMDGGLEKWMAMKYPVEGTNAAPKTAVAQLSKSASDARPAAK